MQQYLPLLYISHTCFSNIQNISFGEEWSIQSKLACNPAILELEPCISQEPVQNFTCLTTMSAAKFGL